MQHHWTPIRVDHVGIAVESVADAEPVLHALGCEKLRDTVAEAGFRWAYYRLGDASRLELIAPVEEDTFLTDFLDRHGAGLHHVTLEVADIDAVVAALEANGLPVVDYTELPDRTEAYLSPRNPTGTLFQLMEYGEGYADDPSAMYIGGHPVGDSE